MEVESIRFKIWEVRENSRMTKCVNVGILTEQTGKLGDGAHGWDMQTGRCK